MYFSSHAFYRLALLCSRGLVDAVDTLRKALAEPKVSNSSWLHDRAKDLNKWIDLIPEQTGVDGGARGMLVGAGALGGVAHWCALHIGLEPTDSLLITDGKFSSTLGELRALAAEVRAAWYPLRFAARRLACARLCLTRARVFSSVFFFCPCACA
jgi:hypothetical protein